MAATEKPEGPCKYPPKDEIRTGMKGVQILYACLGAQPLRTAVALLSASKVKLAAITNYVLKPKRCGTS